MTTPEAGTRIAWPLRTWLFVEIGFGLAAMATIALNPADSATNFAWPIKPTVTAALLGAFYFSSAWVFVLAAFARRWEDIRVMMLPAVFFTAAELLATFLHWDKFSVGTGPFWVWFASYLLPPPILLGCWMWQRKRQVALPSTQPLATPLRVLMIALGTVLVGEGVIAFIRPDILIGSAPWQLTPLTTRALCGWLIALGTMLISAGMAGDRKRTRVLAPFFVLLLPAVAFEVSRFATEVDWTHWRVFGNGAVLLIVFGIGLHLAAAGWRDFFVAGAAEAQVHAGAGKSGA